MTEKHEHDALSTAPTPDLGKVVFAQLEPTTRCNFTCGFCTGRQMDQSDFSVADFERLLDTFPDLEHLELQGEGEPLLHDGFFEMAAQARERGIRLSMITNGSLLSERRVAAILDVGIEAINISIESPDPHEFQKIRGGSLQKVKVGITRLLAARDARGVETPKVGLAITVLKHTIDSLPQVADLYDELGMDGGATLQPLSRMETYRAVYGEDIDAQLLDPEDHQRLMALVRGEPRLQGMMAAGGKNGHFYSELSRRFQPQHGCPWVKGGIYVDRHGGIMSCCMVKDASAHGLGNLGVTPEGEVLEKRREIDAALTAGSPPLQCVGCGYYRAPAARAALEPRRTRAASRRGTRRVLALTTYLDPGWNRLADELGVDVVVARRPELFGYQAAALPAPGGPQAPAWRDVLELLAPAELICGPELQIGSYPGPVIRLPPFSSIGPTPRTLWPVQGPAAEFPSGPGPRVLVVLAQGGAYPPLLAAVRSWARVLLVAPGIAPTAAASEGSPTLRVVRTLPDVRRAECDLLITDLPASIAGDFLHRRIPVVSLQPTRGCLPLPRNPAKWQGLFQAIIRRPQKPDQAAVVDALPEISARVTAARSQGAVP